jgi:hypothetical protein
MARRAVGCRTWSATHPGAPPELGAVARGWPRDHLTTPPELRHPDREREHREVGPAATAVTAGCSALAKSTAQPTASSAPPSAAPAATATTASATPMDIPACLAQTSRNRPRPIDMTTATRTTSGPRLSPCSAGSFTSHAVADALAPAHWSDRPRGCTRCAARSKPSRERRCCPQTCSSDLSTMHSGSIHSGFPRACGSSESGMAAAPPPRRWASD